MGDHIWLDHMIISLHVPIGPRPKASRLEGIGLRYTKELTCRCSLRSLPSRKIQQFDIVSMAMKP